MNVLIIEDEARTARQLAGILVRLDPTIRVMAMLESVEEGIAWLSRREQPDLIFSDIQLADGISFEIFKQVRITCPIIFCTAFDEYMLHAFETNAISYLLKPILPDKVQQALDKFALLRQVPSPEPMALALERMMSQLKPVYKSSLLVNHREKIIPVQVKDVAYFCLDNTVIQLSTLQHQHYFLTTSLDELEKTVDPELFYRANRQFLINRQAVASVERFFSRKLAVKLAVETPEAVIVSKTKAVDFLNWLEGR